MIIKAIETRYAGYLFRSRLEARWAVLFDALGIKWEYEPEGFDLGRAGRYLPDFRLTALDVWIEIKPTPIERGGDAWAKAEALAEHSPVIVAGGNIGAHDLTLFCHDMTDSSGGGPNDFAACMAWSDRIGACFLVDGLRTDRIFCDPDMNTLPWAVNIAKTPRIDPHLRMVRAVSAARSARFEHGARP